MAESPKNTEKRSWKDKMKDWGLIEESQSVVNQPTTSSYKKASVSPNIQQNTSPAPVKIAPALTITGSVNQEKEQKALDYFFNLLDKANLPGPDFFEFYHALKENITTMGATSFDDRMLYNMVFNTLKGMGLKIDTLHSSCKQYIDLLKQHFDSFAADNQKVLEATVSGRQQKINDLNTSIEQKRSQIEKLQQEMVAATSQISIITGEIQKETQNIEETRVAFESAYSKINSEITQVGDKCKEYLPK